MSSSSEQPGILLETRGEYAIITLNRPKALNAMYGEDWSLLAQILREVDQRDDIKITVITGAGKFFSSGANVKRGVGDTTQGLTERMKVLQRFGSGGMDLSRSFYTHSKLLVAALNGPAVGLAAALLGNCDFIYAAECAPFAGAWVFLLVNVRTASWIATPFSALGIVAEGISSVQFAARMGTAKAKEALILGKKQTAKDLHACGFVNRVLPDKPQPAFVDSVLDHLRDQFSNLDLDAAIATRNLIRAALQPEFDAANAREVFAAAARFETGAPQQAFADFASKKRRHKL